MKKIVASFFALVIAISSFAINSPAPLSMKAEEIMMPLFGTNQQISLADYITLTPKEYKTLTGKKLSLKEKISLKLSQRQLKKIINKDGTVNAAKLQKYYDDEQCSHVGWFLIGFFLGAIGLLIAAFTNRDKRRDRVKWALIGWGSWVAVYLIFLIIALSNGGSSY